MHSSVVFSRTACMSETVVPTVEETFAAGIFAQKAAAAELGVAVRPDGCASAGAGRMTRDAAQLAAASSTPGDRRARVLRPIVIVVAVCDRPALEVLVISAPWFAIDRECPRRARANESHADHRPFSFERPILDARSCGEDVDYSRADRRACRRSDRTGLATTPVSLTAAQPTSVRPVG